VLRSPLNGYFCRLDKPTVTPLKIIYKIIIFRKLLLFIVDPTWKYLNICLCDVHLKIIVFCFMSLRRLSDTYPLVCWFSGLTASPRHICVAERELSFRCHLLQCKRVSDSLCRRHGHRKLSHYKFDAIKRENQHTDNCFVFVVLLC
jgi:hypothetical protein